MFPGVFDFRLGSISVERYQLGTKHSRIHTLSGSSGSGEDGFNGTWGTGRKEG